MFDILGTSGVSEDDGCVGTNQYNNIIKHQLYPTAVECVKL